MRSTLFQNFSPPIKLLFFGLLFAITFLCTLFITPYQTTGPELIKNPLWLKDPAFWWVACSSGRIFLEPQHILHLQQELPQRSLTVSQKLENVKRFQHLQLSADIRTDGVVAGSKTWNKARLLLESLYQGDKHLPVPHVVIALDGTHSWHHYTKVFKIYPETERLKITIQLSDAQGSMWIKNISLKKAIVSDLFSSVRIAGFIMWGLFGALLLLPYVAECGSKGTQCILLSLISLIIAGTMVSGDLKQESLNEIKSIGSSLYTLSVPAKPQAAMLPHSTRKEKTEKYGANFFNPLHDVTKIGHFSLFCLLAFTLVRVFPRLKCSALSMDLAMLASGTELLQFFIEGRSPKFSDFMIDMAGIGLGLGFGYLLGRRDREKETIEEKC